MKKLIITLMLLLTIPVCGSVTDTTTKRQYFEPNGSITTFTFTMPVNSSSDITVKKVLTSTGDPTLLVEDTDYSIASTGGDFLNGGVVTISPPLASTFDLVIIRDIVLTQETVSGAVNAASVELMVDKVTRQVQDQRNDIDSRVLRIPDSDPGSLTMTLPNFVDRAGKVLNFDSGGNVGVTTGADTFTVVNGTYDDIIVKSPYVDVRAFSDFATAITTIGSTEATLMITDSQAVDTDITVPENITLHFLRNGLLTIATTKTLTVNGYIQAALFKIFTLTGSGVVVIANNNIGMVPQWWGALGDGSTDDTTAIQAALNAMTNGMSLFMPMPKTYYKVTATLQSPKTIEGIYWGGYGHSKPEIRSTITSGNVILIGDAVNSPPVFSDNTIGNMKIRAGDADTLIFITGSFTKRNRFTNLWLNGLVSGSNSTQGICFMSPHQIGSFYNRFDNIFIEEVQYGITIAHDFITSADAAFPVTETVLTNITMTNLEASAIGLNIGTKAGRGIANGMLFFDFVTSVASKDISLKQGTWDIQTHNESNSFGTGIIIESDGVKNCTIFAHIAGDYAANQSFVNNAVSGDNHIVIADASTEPRMKIYSNLGGQFREAGIVIVNDVVVTVNDEIVTVGPFIENF